MSNNEILKFEPPQENKTVYSSEVVDDGSSALRLEPDASEEKDRNAQIGKLEHEIADTGKLMVSEPVDENIIFEPIKDLNIKPNLAKRVTKFIRKAWLKAGTMVLASATLGSAAACGPIEAAASTPEPVTITATQPPEVHVGDATVKTSKNETNSEVVESTPSPSPTEAPTPTATPEVTSTPKETSPTPVAKTTETPLILKGKDRERVEVNQRFEDFLNGKGEYSEKKLKENGFMTYCGNEVDLGCISLYDENVFAVQGVILHYRRVNEGEVFAFGTKDKNEKRMIVLVEFPSKSFVKNEGRIQFLFYPEPSLFSYPVSKYFMQTDGDYYDFLKSSIGKISSFSIYTCIGSDFISPDLMPDSYKKIFNESIDPKIGINSSLMTNINFVDDENHQFVNSFESAKRFSESEKESIITVSSFDEFDEFLKIEDYSKIPSAFDVCFIGDGS